jgi:hypothetical protein
LHLRAAATRAGPHRRPGAPRFPITGTDSPSGSSLFAERDRFGKWQHALGPSHVLLAYAVDSPEYAFWGSVFGYGAASGKGSRGSKREAQTVKLIERLRLGEISTRECEQLSTPSGLV